MIALFWYFLKADQRSKTSNYKIGNLNHDGFGKRKVLSTSFCWKLFFVTLKIFSQFTAQAGPTRLPIWNSHQPGWSRKNSTFSTYQKLQSPNTETPLRTEVESTINWCKLNRGSNYASRLSLLRTWWIFWRLYKISNWPIAFSNWENVTSSPGLSSAVLSSLTSSGQNDI